MSEWISVKDRLPDTTIDGCNVIAEYLVVVETMYYFKEKVYRDTDVATFDNEDGRIDGKWNPMINDWLGEGWTGCKECHVTHWMPLPEPPKEDV